MKMNLQCAFYFTLLVSLIDTTLANKKDELHAAKLPPCQSCKMLVESFNKGLEKTSRGKFEGGDAAWEEEKLKSYSNSEVRLVEIQETLCSEVERGQNQCHSLAEDSEQILEEWFLKHQEKDLHTWLCIEHLKYCCPENHYGPECTPCEGFPNVCFGNGKCKGSGTRKGSGKCVCERGYTGDSCNGCAAGYHEAYKDDDKLLCSPCHISCEGSCKSAGVKGCSVCKSGWIMDTERGCLDVNECASTKESVCNADQFCVNNEGSYSCLACDKSCQGCTGDGPDMCNKCAEGYERRDNMCMDLSSEQRTAHVSLMRYLTYFGLCLAACIVFQSSPSIAAAMGLLVALYISVSEYMLKTAPSASPQIDPNSIDWGKLLGGS